MDTIKRKLKMLSKSKIKTNRECTTKLYLSEYNPELKAQFSQTIQKTMDNGRVVESLARSQFVENTPMVQSLINEYPQYKQEIRKLVSGQDKSIDQVRTVLKINDEVLVFKVTQVLNQIAEITDKDNRSKIKNTQKLLAENKRVIFEATIKGEVLVMADILYKNDDNTYDVIEIKSGSKLDEDYILDTTIQYYAMVKQSRIRINKIYLWYINSQAQDIENKTDFFNKVDMTEFVKANKHVYLNEVKKAQRTQRSEKLPTIELGSKCSDCPFFNNVCGKESVNNPRSVLNMPNLKSKYNLFNSGVKEINHEDFKTSNFFKKYPHIVESVINNQRYVNLNGIKETLNSWVFPLRFFDFEAYMSAFPLLKNTRPYQQTVVQFSLHELSSSDGELKHYEWLNDVLDNPKEETIKQMLKVLGSEGSIVSYNKTYEITRIKEMMLAYPQYQAELEAIISRFVDLMEVIKANIYDPNFMGSYSLKITSPTLLGYENGGYTDSLIKGGHEFSDYYQEFLTTTDSVRRDEIKNAMLKYCKYDTLNLYLIYKFLVDLISNSEANLNE